MASIQADEESFKEPTSYDPDTLRAAWRALLKERPKLRIRNAADELDVSEAELLATRVGDGVTRLEAETWGTLVEQIPTLGCVMALTRNDHAVHEKTGTYQNIEIHGPMGLVLDEEIDLRLFMRQWAMGFAVQTPMKKDKIRYSLQFFNAQGRAIHKIFMLEESDMDAYHTLVDAYRSDDQHQRVVVTPAPLPDAETPDEEIDVADFQQRWRDLQDTHHFFGLLREFKLSRTQALRLAPTGFAYKVSVESLRKTLELARDGDVPIMVFVGSPGVLQIHSGPVKRLVATGPWYNVLDPRFNLHLREDAIDTAWVVRKPTEDGVVTALELFDAEDNNIAMLFGARKPGIPELESWRTVIAGLQKLDAP